MKDTLFIEHPLQEIVMHDRIYVIGKVKDVLMHLRSYNSKFSTLGELLKSKLN